MLPQRTCVAVLCTLAVVLSCASGQNKNGGKNKAVWYRARSLHEGQGLSDFELRSLSALAEKTQQFKAHLEPILVPRIVGTQGHAAVRKHLVDTMHGLDWSVEQLAFDDNTPVGHKTFTNVVATLNPDAPRRLVLACHYDSKLDTNVFIGATDSAVPCAMLLHLATELKDSLAAHAQKDPDLTLQFIFFDGEEAFRRWTSTDSLYGSRKLAALLNNTPYPRDNQEGTNHLHRMDVMVLLDLLGTEDVSFSNFFRNTEKWYTRMVSYEQRFFDLNLLNRKKRMFQRKNNYNSGIEDDHLPFLRKGVPIVHLIPVPFPKVWHRPSDNGDALHYPTIDDLNRVLFAFTADYLHLQL